MIETEADLRREFDEIRKDIMRSTENALEFGVAVTIKRIESVTPVITGNARAAIGVPGPIAASRVSLSGLESLRDFRARRKGDFAVSTLHLAGMEYFPFIDRKHSLSPGPIRQAPDEIRAAFGFDFG